MNRQPLPLFGTGTKSRSVLATSLRRLNCYVDQNDDKSPITYVGLPGWSLFATAGGIVRGRYSDARAGRIFYVAATQLIEMDSTGTLTVRGTLSTSSGRVSMDSNGNEIMIVDGTAGYIWNKATTTFSTITDPQFPANPTTVAFHNGRFLVTFLASGRVYASDLYAGTAWTGEFFTAESNPDDTQAVAVSHGNVVVFGTETTEFWQDVGGSGLPYQRISGTTADWGLRARHSVAALGDTLVFLAQRAGEPLVIALEGFTGRPVSTTDEAYNIAEIANQDQAIGFGYMLGGHALYQINFPTRSFLYDDTTELWSDLESFGLPRHRADTVAQLNGIVYFTDYQSGKIYKQDKSLFAEDTQPLAFEIVSRHIFRDDNTNRLSAVQADFEVGNGSNPSLSPVAALSISRDGGWSYGPELYATLGKTGQYQARALWRRLGRGRDITLKLRVTDSVPRILTGASAIMYPGSS